MATCYKKTAALQLVVGVREEERESERREKEGNKRNLKTNTGTVTATAQPDLAGVYICLIRVFEKTFSFSLNICKSCHPTVTLAKSLQHDNTDTHKVPKALQCNRAEFCDKKCDYMHAFPSDVSVV
ncbi:UNVERIFIED_CONTAM: hypothetical protein FKN15_041039 [Acipenser sinensis]